jgi:hypothetical protein
VRGATSILGAGAREGEAGNRDDGALTDRGKNDGNSELLQAGSSPA